MIDVVRFLPTNHFFHTGAVVRDQDGLWALWTTTYWDAQWRIQCHGPFDAYDGRADLLTIGEAHGSLPENETFPLRVFPECRVEAMTPAEDELMTAYLEEIATHESIAELIDAYRMAETL